MGTYLIAGMIAAVIVLLFDRWVCGKVSDKYDVSVEPHKYKTGMLFVIVLFWPLVVVLFGYSLIRAQMRRRKVGENDS